MSWKETSAIFYIWRQILWLAIPVIPAIPAAPAAEFGASPSPILLPTPAAIPAVKALWRGRAPAAAAAIPAAAPAAAIPAVLPAAAAPAAVIISATAAPGCPAATPDNKTSGLSRDRIHRSCKPWPLLTRSGLFVTMTALHNRQFVVAILS